MNGQSNCSSEASRSMNNSRDVYKRQVLECNLIKEHRPKYNTMLMDDKAYPFIKVTMDEPFPRIMTVSYTHLDVYKRQLQFLWKVLCSSFYLSQMCVKQSLMRSRRI